MSLRVLNPNAEVLNKSAALHMNINAAKGLQDVLKTNLGPKGTIKMYGLPSLSLSLSPISLGAPVLAGLIWFDAGGGVASARSHTRALARSCSRFARRRLSLIFFVVCAGLWMRFLWFADALFLDLRGEVPHTV